mmetsp:Transcript_33207/g.76578  ORF Transcript_33207/g.76578 Transcript_33207/m.76578 type:complete len:101 (+) Transcript_33207:1089-1391(+)
MDIVSPSFFHQIPVCSGEDFVSSAEEFYKLCSFELRHARLFEWLQRTTLLLYKKQGYSQKSHGDFRTMNQNLVIIAVQSHCASTVATMVPGHFLSNQFFL